MLQSRSIKYLKFHFNVPKTENELFGRKSASIAEVSDPETFAFSEAPWLSR